MARLAKPGENVAGYEVVKEVNKGAFAVAYKARGKDRGSVFLKQYKSPGVSAPWYKGYVNYQQELKERIENTKASEYCYNMVDFFVAKKVKNVKKWDRVSSPGKGSCYFQAFEFVDDGHDMQVEVDKIRVKRSTYPYTTRITLARVMMAGIKTLHSERIVHCDLKPENLQLFKDDSIAAKWRLKIIDMDFTLLADKEAPWSGHQGYVGTPNYFSPEHLGGVAPCPASDVFTCGLILYELLAESGHPYAFEDPEEYKEAATNHKADPPRLVGKLQDNKYVANFLHSCLSPNPNDRPTAGEVWEVLLKLPKKGKHETEEEKEEKKRRAEESRKREEEAREEAGRKKREEEKKERRKKEDEERKRREEEAEKKAEEERRKKEEERERLRCRPLTMVSESGKSSRPMRIKTVLGKMWARQYGDDAKYWSDRQCVIEPKDGQWYVSAESSAKNTTLLNGKTLEDRQQLEDGDIVSVGREGKTSKLPITVRIS